jgi:formate hydrogenlyase transcriptional activator
MNPEQHMGLPPLSPATNPDQSLSKQLVEGSPDCIKVLDLDGRLLSMNAGGMKVLEICDLTLYIGSSWIDFWQGADREAAQAAVMAAREGGIGRFVGFFPTTETRKPMWFDVMVSPIADASGKPEKLLAASRDVTTWKRSDQLLHAIIDGRSTDTGREFFQSLVEKLAKSLGVGYSFVAECVSPDRARSLAFWIGDKPGPDFEYDLQGTPCLRVSEGQTCYYESNLQHLFPANQTLIEMSAESYLGVPLRDSAKDVIGHLVIMDDKPMAVDPLLLSVMATLAGRAGAELERTRAYEQLQRSHTESEERFRDLFEEAPIAYVNEGLDSKFIRANRAAMKSLGISPEDVSTTYGRTFVPDTPEAQKRLRLALESVGKGIDTSGVVLELRRKDNGKPLWIQWWSRPDPSGTYTRTMFLDITERVLIEEEKARLEAQNKYLQDEIRSEHNFDEIIGRSPALLNLLRQVEQISKIDSTVLVLGETGTGKELIARAIHDRSPRKNRALVKVNCGAIATGLVESELFGHVKGSFTGAIAHRDGRFKVADGGTIFLDEVGELPLDTQVKLLRVLQEQEFEPIGSSRTISVNVRVVAATNRDLEEMVREGKFRADLYYRLSVVPLRVPALRERLMDLPLLVPFFVQKCAVKLGKQINSVSEEAMSRLTNYSWPGNIRELQNVIERAVILSPGNTLVLAEELRTAPTAGIDIAVTKSPIDPVPAYSNVSSLDDVERWHIESVLNQVNWKIEGEHGAAKILAMNPSTLRSRMQKLGINRPSRPPA